MIYIGLDISKASIDIAILDGDKHHHQQIANTPTSINAWLNTLPATALHVVCEYTNIYHHTIAHALHDAGYTISVMNPYIIKRFADTIVRNKTDKSDAYVLAHYARIYQPEPWQPLQHQNISQLQKRIEQLVNMRTMERNRAYVSDDVALQSVNRMLAVIEQEINVLEHQLETMIATDQTLQSQRDLLTTIPGIGNKTANILLPLLSSINRFETANKLVSYLGLAPRSYQSGTSVYRQQRITKMGNTYLRKALYMPARTACLRSKVFIPWAQAKLSAGKPPKVVYVAMMRKLLVYAYHVIKTNKPFDLQDIVKNHPQNALT